MKDKFQLVKVIIALLILIYFTSISVAQPPPPPPNGGHGIGNNSPPGGGAPIGDAMYLLIGLAGLYGGKKVYELRKSSPKCE